MNKVGLLIVVVVMSMVSKQMWEWVLEWEETRGASKKGQEELFDMTSYYLKTMGDWELKKENQNLRLSFGYSSDIDVVVDGLAVFKALGFDQVTPRLEPQLNTLQDIAQTLAYFFVQGAGAEMRVTNSSAFEEVKKKSLELAKYVGLGGNAVTMAIRAQKEGSQVLLGCAMDDKYYSKYFNNSQPAHLIHSLAPIRDYHLVLDFDQRDTWGTLTSKRSNRFYLNYDIDNIQLTYMQPFHKQEPHFHSDIIALGGFQLIQNVPKQVYQKIFSEVGAQVQQVKNAKVHIELGTFFEQELLDSLTEKVIKHSHSLGFNEQELAHLKQSLLGHTLDSDVDSTPDVQHSLEELVEFLALIQQKGLSIDRLHFHSLKFQAICSTNAWGHPRLALSHSVMIAPLISLYNYKYSLDTFLENKEQIYKLIELMTYDYPSTLDLYHLDQTITHHKVHFNDPITCWNPSDKFQCCVTPMIFSKYPLRTRGLGDNISSVGLVYHKKL